MALIKTDYGLIYNDDGSLCTTVRKDDVPFPGVSSFAVEEGTTNLIINGDFSNGLNNWATNSDATVTLGKGNGYFDNSVIFTATSAGNIGSNRLWQSGVLQVSTQYSFSGYIRRISGTGGLLVANDGTSGNLIGLIGNSEAWTRFEGTFTTGSSSSSTIGFYPNAANDVFELTGLQVEQKPFATSFVDGTRNNGKFVIPSIVDKDNFVVNLWQKSTAWDFDNYSVGIYVDRNNRFDLKNFYSTGSLVYEIVYPDGAGSYLVYRKIITSPAVLGEWNMYTWIKNGLYVAAYANGNKVIEDTINSAIDTAVSSSLYDVIIYSKTNQLTSNLLIAKYDPAIWTADYIKALYDMKRPFTAPIRMPVV